MNHPDHESTTTTTTPQGFFSLAPVEDHGVAAVKTPVPPGDSMWNTTNQSTMITPDASSFGTATTPSTQEHQQQAVVHHTHHHNMNDAPPSHQEHDDPLLTPSQLLEAIQVHTVHKETLDQECADWQGNSETQVLALTAVLSTAVSISVAKCADHAALVHTLHQHVTTGEDLLVSLPQQVSEPEEGDHNSEEDKEAKEDDSSTPTVVAATEDHDTVPPNSTSTSTPPAVAQEG